MEQDKKFGQAKNKDIFSYTVAGGEKQCFLLGMRWTTSSSSSTDAGDADNKRRPLSSSSSIVDDE